MKSLCVNTSSCFETPCIKYIVLPPLLCTEFVYKKNVLFSSKMKENITRLRLEMGSEPVKGWTLRYGGWLLVRTREG